jgi:hypothetical protein
MQTADIRNLILTRPLKEQGVTIAEWPDTSLIIRELSAADASAIVDGATGADGKTNQTALIASVVIATLRNAEDKSLIFAPTDRDALLATGLGPIMEVAQASIALSGLNAAAGTEAKNG